VAIIGGGCAGITAAFELSRPEHGGRYQITLYQQGWRLGGKGASGRGPSGRIEEHGLHVILGYYYNMFRLLRECYAELGYDWRAAFKRESAIGVMERVEGDEWRPWLAHFPENEEEPGDPDLVWPPSGIDYLTRAIRLVVSLLESARQMELGVQAEEASRPDVPSLLRWLAGGTQLAGLAVLLEGTRVADWLVSGGDRSGSSSPAVALLRGLQRAVQDRIASLVGERTDLRRVWIVADIVLANLRGMLAERLIIDPRGFDAIDDWDYREWLAHHGASRHATESALVRGLYDLAFAYEDGNPARPRIAAGVALRCAVRTFFTYQGALFWKMKGGMGDVIFAPFYEALRGRGVTFEFFHRLEHVSIGEDEDGRHVAGLEFDVQARVQGGAPYHPLVEVNGTACWPAEPDYGQLDRGPDLQLSGVDFESHWDRSAVGHRTLRVGADFDQVVLTAGIGALPHLCPELTDSDPRWAAMVQNVKTVSTQAFQLWLTSDLDGLGWEAGPASVSGYKEPFDTWSDMTYLLDHEAWAERPGSIAYFCNTLPDPEVGPSRGDVEYPASRKSEVRENAIAFLRRDVHAFWPAVGEARTDFPWRLLASDGRGDSDPDDPERFDTQYWRANVHPSDRYVLCLPGSVRYRISPLDFTEGNPTSDNLTLAGDWTATGLNAGCVEGAVISGRLAAHAISGSPPLHEIVGFDHP